MIKQFLIKDKCLQEDIEVIRADFKGLYYKVIFKGVNDKESFVVRYEDFDDLLIEHIKLALDYAILESKIEELERRKAKGK